MQTKYLPLESIPLHIIGEFYQFNPSLRIFLHRIRTTDILIESILINILILRTNLVTTTPTQPVTLTFLVHNHIKRKQNTLKISQYLVYEVKYWQWGDHCNQKHPSSLYYTKSSYKTNYTSTNPESQNTIKKTPIKHTQSNDNKT